MATNSFSQQVYSDFSGGFNDTSAAISIKDDQLALSENVDYAAEVKALQTRKGCSKVNQTSYGANVTDGYSWLVGSTFKKCVVMNGKLYDLDISNGNLTEKLTLTEGATHIYPFVMYDVLYFGDGTELYEWGGTDHSTDMKVEVVKKDEIVRYNLDTGDKGTKGHFYRLLTTKSGSVTYADENFKDTTLWQDVTDVPNHSSGYVRPMTHYDPSAREVVTISVSSDATNAATITVVLGGVEKTLAVTASQGINSIASGIGGLTFTGWSAGVVSNNKVTFTATEVGIKDNSKHYVNPATCGAAFTVSVATEGRDDDCDISAIKKCTIFCVHQGSYRVFAGGNPEDSALFFSEVGNARYFKSEINKVYPAVNGYGQVTAMSNFSDYLLVSYENGWYSWKGSAPLTDAYWKPLNIPYGCVSPRTLCLTPSSFTFLSRDGIYCVSASIMSDDYILLQGDQVIRKLSENMVEKTINDIANRTEVEAIFYNNVYLLAYRSKSYDEEDDPTNHYRVLKYEWDTASFTLVTGWKVNRWLNDPEELYFASKNYILKAFDGYSDVYTESYTETVSAMVITIPKGRMIGDLDGDGVITDKDTARLMGILTGRYEMPKPGTEDFIIADVYKDGEISTPDAVKLMSVQTGTEPLGSLGSVDSVYSVNPLYESEESQFYTDISVPGFSVKKNLVMYSQNENIVSISKTFSNKVRVFVKSIPASDIEIEYKLVTGSGIVSFEKTAFVSTVVHNAGSPKPIDLHVKTKEYHFGTPMSNKVSQLIGFIFQQHDQVDSSVDIVINAGYQHYSIGSQDLAESLAYGRAWGKAWGYREAIVKVAEIIMISNTFQIELKNSSIDDPITLIGIGFVYEKTDIITPTIWKDEVLLT